MQGKLRCTECYKLMIYNCEGGCKQVLCNKSNDVFLHDLLTYLLTPITFIYCKKLYFIGFMFWAKEPFMSNSIWPGLCMMWMRQYLRAISCVEDFTPVILLAAFGWMACITFSIWVLWWTGYQTMQYAGSSSHQMHQWCEDREGSTLPEEKKDPAVPFCKNAGM